MKHVIYTPLPNERIGELRLITRSLLLLALLTAILYIRVFMIASPLTSEVGIHGEIGLLSSLFLTAATVGLLLAWRWEGLGGIVMTVSGISLAVLTFLTSAELPWLTAFFYGSPFAITGILSLVCWWKARHS
ncbi:MAG: hypothetical protein WAM60_15710 [Candidatus Promineifilaceae bacterium]